MTMPDRKPPPRRRAGRPRKAGARHPCGQLVQGADTAILPQALERRADLLGSGAKAGQLLDQRAGHALGQLLLRGRITQQQHDAGLAVGATWRRWLSLADAPRQFGGGTLGTASATDPRAWTVADGNMARLRAIIAASSPHGALALSLAETLCVDEIMPRRFEPGWVGEWPVGWAALGRALDALADHYRMTNN